MQIMEKTILNRSGGHLLIFCVFSVHAPLLAEVNKCIPMQMYTYYWVELLINLPKNLYSRKHVRLLHSVMSSIIINNKVDIQMRQR